MSKITEISSHPFVVIISPPRCRSTYLHQLINSHPLAVCHHEIFHQTQTIIKMHGLPKDDLLNNLSWRNRNPTFYISRLIEKSLEYNPMATTIGCKLIIYKPQLKLGLDALLDFNPKVLLLRRENKLAWYSSYRIALETKEWAIRKRKKEQYKISFDETQFEFMLNSHQKIRSEVETKLQELNIEYHEIEYFDLDNPSKVADILKFIELPPFSLSVNTVMQNSEDLLTRFQNPQHVKPYLVKTNHLHWLHNG